jgi:RNA polymerase sigma-70 factor (ECF subfamily)
MVFNRVTPTRSDLLDADAGAMDHAHRSTRFVELLTSHQRDLFVYIDTLMAGDAAVPDVLQDTNLALWSRLSDFDFSRPFLPWAYGFSYQRVLAFRKQRSRSRLVFNEEMLELISDIYVSDQTNADSRLAALQQCLAKLDATDGELIRDRYVDRMPIKTLAARLGRTANQLSVRLFRIRYALARCVETRVAGEG